jgi:ABC-type branched-subunit amino acid transport system ATPase component
MTPVLETRRLIKRFGGIVATDCVDFRLEAGARHALIGPNGAGKTTFVNLISGVLAPSSGEILLDGQNVVAWSARRRARAGLARTFQINQLFRDFTTLETLLFAVTERENHGWEWLRPTGARSEFVDEAAEVARSLGLEDALYARVGALPYGKQRLLEIAIAVAARPKALLLDEPAAGVPEGEREQILDVVFALPATVGLLLIEHDMDLVFRFANRISVLVNGALLVEGPPAEIARDERVRRVYLGDEEITHV